MDLSRLAMLLLVFQKIKLPVINGSALKAIPLGSSSYMPKLDPKFNKKGHRQVAGAQCFMLVAIAWD